ncbi:MAG: 3-dehydroquinate synthase [Acidobacteriota bacterium]|nr:3-dehydroquinate synthase [Acidobacteriota bacterium]
MPSFQVQTPQRTYAVVVERGVLQHLREFVPPASGRIFVITTEDVWLLHGGPVAIALQKVDYEVLYFPGGEPRKRLGEVEILAERLASLGADRSSLIVAIGGGIVTDLAGFLAAIFMRGIPVIQIPTTLLAQVDAAVGGKTGVNLAAGKNLLGSFHQPLHVLVDPAVLDTLPEREYRAGLFEVIKHGVIADPALFDVMHRDAARVLAHEAAVVDRMISDSVRIKAEVVSSDEKEDGQRRILNFGHTFGHALEAETSYSRFLHGEAVAWGMKAATVLARMTGILDVAPESEILACIDAYGRLPALAGVEAPRLQARLKGDKKTIQGRVHFVLPERIGRVRITADLDQRHVFAAIEQALAT